MAKEYIVDLGSLRFNNCVIFGGTGFIGSHLARFLLVSGLVQHIFLADIQPPNQLLWSLKTRKELEDERVHYVPIDVRSPIASESLPKSVDLIVNLAAVHREPGHVAREYFETNLKGADNICRWAELVNCNQIVFTSSISPYGPTEEPKNEDSLPVPVTAYGASKLVAEKIHLAWQHGGPDRQLTIVRPGVVFGPGEGGNVSRLIRSVVRNYFFYAGNQQTRKAGGYVKELCNAILWVLAWQKQQHKNVVLFNFSADPTPTLQQYVDAVSKIAQIRRSPLKVPYPLLLGISYPISKIANIVGLKQPIDPVRIRKLVRSNNIMPSFLTRNGYAYRYTLEEALKDWQLEKPEDWT